MNHRSSFSLLTFLKDHWLVLGVAAIAFVWRAFGLRIAHPFWVDEFSTGVQARLLLENGLGVFTNPQISFEHHNLLNTSLTSLAFSLLGASEQSARWPTVILGSAVPLYIYFFCLRHLDKKTGMVASILSAFSLFLITWSVQARGYILQQLFVLASFDLYLILLKSKDRRSMWLGIWLVIQAIAIINHKLHVLALVAMLAHATLYQRQIVKGFLTSISAWMLGALTLGWLYFNGSFTVIAENIQVGFLSLHNNVWYYHSFLWRQQTLTVFMAAMGLMCLWRYKSKVASLITLYLLIFLAFISFMFELYVSRYTLSLFVWFYVLFAYALVTISELLITDTPRLNKTWVKWLVTVGMALFIIANGHTFVTKPKPFYSVNAQMREIALIDYHQVYGLIKEKGQLEKNETAIIESWPDRAKWYVGLHYKPLYVVHWRNKILTNIPYSTNEVGEKVLPQSDEMLLMTTVDDLKLAMQKYPRGFMWIDDTALPEDVIVFANENLKKELVVDHYHYDDNPYSLWPATLYSWGIE